MSNLDFAQLEYDLKQKHLLWRSHPQSQHLLSGYDNTPFVAIGETLPLQDRPIRARAEKWGYKWDEKWVFRVIFRDNFTGYECSTLEESYRLGKEEFEKWWSGLQYRFSETKSANPPQ